MRRWDRCQWRGSRRQVPGTRTRTVLLAISARMARGWSLSRMGWAGSPPRGREAAIAAIRGLPRRISTPEELHDGFASANDQVAGLTPGHLRFTMSDFHLCPAATLCAAAWTPTGGLLVGYAVAFFGVAFWAFLTG